MHRTALFFDGDTSLVSIWLAATPNIVETLEGVLKQDLHYRAGQLILNLPQAVKSARWAGQYNGTSPSEADVSEAVYECLVYKVFNALWEGGLDAAERGEGCR